MPADLTAASWVLQITREELVADLGVITTMRAEGYAASGRVRTLVAGPGGQMLLATVAGSARHVYQTIVRRVGEHGAGWVGQCSCPVGSDCKHAAAVLLSAQQRLRDAGVDGPATWESALAELVRTPGPEAGGRQRVPLAIQLSVEHPPLAAPEVMMRPVRPGKGSRWVRSGVSWRDLASPWSSPDVQPAQRAALAQLHSVAQGGGHYAHYAAAQLPLGGLGTLAWPLLQRCREVGVELVPGTGVADVVLGEGRVAVTLDLSRGEDGGLTLQPRFGHDGTPAPAQGQRFLLGEPPHGMAHLDDGGRLTLWPLASVPAGAVSQLVARQTPVHVPAEDVDRFLTLYYPAMARQVELSSVDGTVPAAAVVRPRLRLDVTPLPEHTLRLEWSFTYALPTASGDSTVTRFPLVRSPQDPPRDRDAEDAAVRAVLPLLDDVRFLLDTSGPVLARGGPRPASPLTLDRHRIVRLVGTALPRLLASEDVDVVVHGELPRYEEADEAPVLTIETRSGDAHDWFDLHVTVTVGGEPVPLEELLAALVRGDPTMFLPSGTYFPLQTAELDALRRLIDEARELEDAPPRPGTVRITPYQAGLWEELVQLGVVGAQSEGWQRSVSELLSLGDADRGVVRPPDGLEAELRLYQLDGFRWLSTLWDAGLGGVLADDMGLGKTLQTLAMVTRAEQRGDLADGAVLVVAPTSVVATWAEEAARFAPGLRVATVTATERRRGHELGEAVGGADLVITSYTLLRLESDDYRALPWSAVVLDEAQFVKNHRSATYQAARRLGAPRTFAITGTPLENSLMDLWSMLSLAAPGLFPRPEVFTERYRKPIEAGDAPPGLLDTLRRRVRPFMLRRTKSEVANELPAKTEQTLHVDLHPAHRRVYDRHLARERQRVLGLLSDMDKNRVAIFRALTALRQLALDPSLVSDEHEGLATSAKIATLVEQVTELAAEGHRALVFSSFTGYLALVRRAVDAAGISYSYLDGRTRDRAARIAAFRDGDDPLFLISLKAGGFGLTLTEADYVFVLDPWWNPAAESQAIDRTHRIGQTRPVNVYRLVSTDTVEEKVVALQQRKRDLFATVVDAGEFRSGAITAADVRDLLGE
ncbi:MULTISPECIES: SNF2-related protein [unclassified Ornithinimicrobium]|uniref:DEAD/DEAH box helicase n=1 Tax=unclassified Ornithinimicrobium TaxID=2615080 RepID=UPI0038545C3A